MNRYNLLFKKLYKRNEGAFIPFIILGDPNPNINIKIIDSIIFAGANALELGIPFSDPIADGPIIQKGYMRVLIKGFNINICYSIISIIRNKYKNLPIGLLVYANLILNKGINKFYAICSKLGIDSVLIADVPIEESNKFRYYSLYNNISHIFICPHNANDDLILNISLYGKGYTYLITRTGVTGSDISSKVPSLILLNKLIKYKVPPIIQGFGIYQFKQVYNIINTGISGVISGSAIIKIIEYYLLNEKKKYKLFNKLINWVINMKKFTFNLK